MEDQQIKKIVREEYGNVAKRDGSCCGPTVSCCGSDSYKEISKKIGYAEEALKSIPDGANLGLGCGNPVALASLRKGEIVLDLGSGAGLDCFLAAKKVGEKGKVIGVDMTEEMIKKARAIAQENGYKNVEFRLGEIEELPIEDCSVDVVISNCVVNLSPDKQKVFQEAHRVLKTGGRIMISDLVTEEELPEEVRKSFDAWAGCIAGALEKRQYLDTIRKAGFKDVRIVSESTYNIGISRELSGKITSVQVEAFKS